MEHTIPQLTADINSAYNQMPLGEQSQRLTQFLIGNQHTS